MDRKRAAFWLPALTLFLAGLPSPAQSTGAIAGEMTTTTSAGHFSAPSLPPANYTASAEVDTTATGRVDLTLARQDSKVTIDVTARSAIQTSMTGNSATVGTTINPGAPSRLR